jgi:hypothetical protein
VRMDRFATSVRATAFGSGASRPAVDGSGRYAYIRLQGSEVGTGSLWTASGLQDVGEKISVPADWRISSASFVPEPGSVLIAEANQGGIWLLSLAGHAQRLSQDGWLPRWLP